MEGSIDKWLNSRLGFGRGFGRSRRESEATSIVLTRRWEFVENTHERQGICVYRGLVEHVNTKSDLARAKQTWYQLNGS